MPYNGICSGTYEAIFAKFTLNDSNDLQSNIDDLKSVYTGKQLSHSVMEQAINAGVNHFKLRNYIRTPAEQDRCATRSAAMQDAIAKQLVSQKMFNQSWSKTQKTLNGQRIFFLLRNTEHTNNADDLKFNNEVLAACNGQVDHDKLDRLKYTEFKRISKELGIQTAKDLANLYTIDEQKLVDNFDQYSRFARYVAELQDLRTSTALTPEEQKDIYPFATLGVQLVGFLGSLADLIANPYYALFDTQRLYKTNPSIFRIHEKMDNLENKGVDFAMNGFASCHPLGSYFTHLNFYSRNAANAMVECVELLHPKMQGAVYGTKKVSAALENYSPVVAHAKDGTDYVLINTPNILAEPQTVADYAKQLAKQAAKADKFLLTGSDQFTAMRKQLDKYVELQDRTDVDKEEKLMMASELLSAAKKYFQHKQKQRNLNLGESFDMTALLHAGKNQREQSRMDVAAYILHLAQSQYDALSNVITQEKEGPKVELSPEEKSANALVQRNLTFVNQEKDFANNINNLTKQKAPTEAVAENADPLSAEPKEIMTQDEFDALCTMACSSKEATYQRKEPVKDAQGGFVTETVKVKVQFRNKETGELEVFEREEQQQVKQLVTKPNNNPDKLYDELLNSIQSGKRILGHTDGMIRGVSQSLSTQLSQKNFEMSGRMLADGIMMNNKIMRNEQGFTSKFDTCARLNEKALQMLDKYPQLREVVNSHLDPQELVIAKNGQALYNVHREGIQAQQDLISRCGMEDASGFSNAVNENKADVAKICHMYDAEQKYAIKQLTLDTLNLKTYTQNTQSLREALQNDQTIDAFVNGLNGKTRAERINLIGSPREMSNLFAGAAQNQKQILDMQNQPQPQHQLQVSNTLQQKPSQPAPHTPNTRIN